MSITLVPGDLFELECTTGTSSSVKIGQKIPNEQNPVAVILTTQEKSYQVGVLKSGEFELVYPCKSGDQKISVSVSLPENAQSIKKYDPLSPFYLNYPAWLIWLMLALLLFFISGTFYVYWLRNRKIKQVAQKPREISLEEKLISKLSHSSRDRFINETQGSKVRQLYDENIELFRKYMEQVLELKTEFFTSKELVTFVCALNAVQGFDPQKSALLESLFLRAEQVRFAGSTPSTQEKEAFFNDLNLLFQNLKNRRVHELRKS